MTETEQDQFAELLAEALRAGPGSLPWREAVSKLESNPSGADEYQLLLSARENLEKGKSFREIRAGAGFTRKLMEGLEQDQKRQDSKGIPTPTIVAIVAVAAIIGALAWIGYHMLPRGDRGHSTADLASTYFTTELATAKFTGGMPSGWRVIGSLPLDGNDGLRPRADDQTAGGGVVLAAPIPLDEPFAFEVDSKLAHPADGLVTQIFVSTSGDFSADRGTSGHELLWSLRGKSQQVVLDGRVLPISAGPLKDGMVHVRILMNRDQALVECNGQRLWSGPHELAPAPRWPGVRFIRGPGTGQKGVEIRSIRVLKP
jgi:hypothetical protein